MFYVGIWKWIELYLFFICSPSAEMESEVALSHIKHWSRRNHGIRLRTIWRWFRSQKYHSYLQKTTLIQRRCFKYNCGISRKWITWNKIRFFSSIEFTIVDRLISFLVDDQINKYGNIIYYGANSSLFNVRWRIDENRICKCITIECKLE